MAGHDARLRRTGYTLAASLVVALLVVNALGIFFSNMIAQGRQQLLNSTTNALGILNGVRAEVNEARAGVDEFIYIGDTAGSSLYQEARAELDNEMRRLVALPKISTETTRDINQIQRLTSLTLAALQTVVQLRESGQTEIAMQQLATGDVRQELVTLHSESAHLAATLESLQRRQSAATNSAALTENAVLAAVALGDVVAFTAILLLVRRTATLREQYAAAQARAEEETRRLALEETNRRMSEFLSIASHEIRTPLTSLKTSLQLASRTLQRDDPADVGLAKVTSLVQHAVVATDRLEYLVGQLVDSSHIQSGAFEPKSTTLDLAQIVRESVEEQRLLHSNRTITLTTPEGATLVMADATAIWHVVTNYLVNALKFSTEASPVQVYLTSDGREALVAVADQGPGIPLEEQEQIWRKFYRAPGIEHLSGSSVGFGLGLYICKSVIEQLGGAVGVQSAVGQGSTFWFKVPLALSPAAAPSPPDAPSGTDEHTPEVTDETS